MTEHRGGDLTLLKSLKNISEEKLKIYVREQREMETGYGGGWRWKKEGRGRKIKDFPVEKIPQADA